MAELPINYGDTGRIARDKINDSFNALVEQVEWYEPHIVDWIWWIWETNTWVKAEWDHVQMKVEWNYIRYKSDTVSWTTLILLSDLKWPQWDQWDAATITVWSTVTWAAWTSASVENVGSSSEAVLKFVIPAWAKWDPWEDWEDWEDGESATIEIWTTTTWEPWTDASVTNSGTSSAAVLNFTIPAGLKWDPWEDGEDGNWIASITSSKSWKITTVTITETNGDKDTFTVSDWEDWQGAGDVLWPNSSTDWNVVLFDWTTWKLIKDSWKTIPTQASDVNALPSSTKYWASLTVSIDSDYKVTTTLKDQDGNTLGTAQVIDLPLESVVVWGSYDDQTKKVILTLQNGNTIEFSVADLVSWLQSEITSSNKLDADLVDDSTSTNKFVTANDKSTWNWKQDAINDLADIRNGASAWATALQSGDNVSELDNDAGYLTSHQTLKTVNGNSLTGSGNVSVWTLTAETVASGDSGTNYTIKVSSSAPASWTPNTTITFVTA